MKYEIVKLDSVAEIIAGQSPESKYYNKEGEGVPFFQGKADFGVDYPTVRYYCTVPTKMAKPLDILLSVRAPVGPTNICDVDACVGRGLAAIRCKEKLDYKYLYFFLKTIEKKLAASGNGSTFSAITTSVIKEIDIPLPPLSIQREIADLLDKADALRRKDRTLLQAYEALAQAIFMDMFGDPVKNEKGWELVTFDNLFTTRLGKMLDAKKQIGNKQYKYLGNSNVQWFKFNLDNLSEMEFDEKDIKTFELKQDDILICEGGEVGRAAIWNNDMQNVFFQKAIHRARIKTNNITPEFTVILLWFLAKYGGLKDYVTTSTISHLTGEKLKTLPMPLPPYDLQLKFSQLMKSLNSQRLLLEKTVNDSESLFQTLLQRSFS